MNEVEEICILEVKIYILKIFEIYIKFTLLTTYIDSLCSNKTALPSSERHIETPGVLLHKLNLDA